MSLVEQAMFRPVAGLKIHPASALIPEMRPDEYRDLLDDIREHGIKVPLDLVGDVLLDGRHRLKASIQLGLVEVPVRDVTLNGESQEEYVLKAALLRRHLTDDQRAMIAARYAKEHPRPTGAAAHGRSTPHPVGADLRSQHRSQAKADAASIMNVSAKRAQKAAAILSKAPDLARQVHQGDIPIGEALRQIRKGEVSEKVLKLPEGKYRVLYADPPWQYSNDGLVNDAYCRTGTHYPSMSIEELCALPVKDLAADDAVLFLWVTSPLLEESFQVIRAWGFAYKANITWDKVRNGWGHYVSIRHEHLLICTRGSCTPDNSKLFDSVVSIERSNKHSEKPEQFRSMIDALYPLGPRVELFARRRVDGWAGWGNEVP